MSEENYQEFKLKIQKDFIDPSFEHPLHKIVKVKSLNSEIIKSREEGKIDNAESANLRIFLKILEFSFIEQVSN